MLSIKWGARIPGHSCGIYGEVFLGEDRICSVHTWGFASCACYTLQGFNNFKILSEEQVVKFFELLNTKEPSSEWIPTEIYFLLAPYQRNIHTALTQHPSVRKVDSFTNKAHGESTMSLFRYSKQMDFT